MSRHLHRILRPTLALWAILVVGLGAPRGLPAGTTDLEPAAASESAGPTLQEATEVERPRSRVCPHHRVRKRSRNEDGLAVASWESPLPSFGARAADHSEVEAVRILRVRGALVLSWRVTLRNARSGVLHAHSSSCPPPVRS